MKQFHIYTQIHSRKAPFRLYPGVKRFLVLQDHLFTSVLTKLLGLDIFGLSSCSAPRVLPVAPPQLRDCHASPSLTVVHALCHTICFPCEARCGLPPSVQMLRPVFWPEILLAPGSILIIVYLNNIVLGRCPPNVLN